MPTYKLLFIWVEGDDDERFFNKILVPKFLEKYSGVKIIKYAAMRKKKVDNFIKSMYSPKKFDFNTLKQLMGYGRLTEKKEAIHKV